MNLLQQPSRLQHIRASRIAKQINPYRLPDGTNPIILFHFQAQQNKKNHLNRIILHFTYEQRFKHYKTMLHQIWGNAFGKTPITQTKLIAGTCNHSTLTRDLIRRAPYKPAIVTKAMRKQRRNKKRRQKRKLNRKLKNA